MAHQEIVVGSRNEGKIREIRAQIEDLPVQLLGLAEFPHAPEIQEAGATLQENARFKALGLAAALNCWVLADDSGLEVDALGGAPGVLSARFAGRHGDDSANNLKLLDALVSVPEENRTARFRCAIALAEPGRILLAFEGACEGLITFAPRGGRGFGYDPLFYYPPAGQTFGELEDAIKNRVSHRAQALRKLRQGLLPLLEGGGSASSD